MENVISKLTIFNRVVTRKAHKSCKPVGDVHQAGVEGGGEAGAAEEAHHPRPALVQELLPPPERLVVLGARAAVVGGEEDHSVLLEALKPQGLHDVAHSAVQGGHSRGPVLLLLCIFLQVP